MSEQIQAVRFDVQDIGKHVKTSKKRYSWIFGLNNRHHTIVLDFSFISYKVKLVVDRKTMLQTQLPDNASFQHPFALDGFAINILQQGDTFQLRINNKVFSHLYNQAKTNQQFKSYQDQVKQIQVDQAAFQNTNKIVKINIGALQGTKKKNKNTVQTDNWSNFGGGADLGIPSYFGDTNKQNKTKKTQQLIQPNLLQQDTTQTSTPQISTFPTKSKPQQINFFAQQPTQPPVSTSPSQQLLQQLAKQQQKQQQFNTMQHMFATVNIQNNQTTPQQLLPQTGIDLLNNACVTNQPTQQNYNDFNTMQNLFATQNQTPTYFTPPSPPQPSQAQYTNISSISGTNIPNLPKTNPNYNPMQPIFSTISYQPTYIQNQIDKPGDQLGQQYYHPHEFTTMQNMSKITPQMQNIGKIASPPFQPITQLPSKPPTTTTPNLIQNPPYQTGSDFNTMQNLFATQNQLTPNIQPPINPPTLTTPFPQQLPTQPYKNQLQFNTMQNIFSTGLQQKTPSPSQFQSNPPTLQNLLISNNITLTTNKPLESPNIIPNQQIPFNLSFPPQQTPNQQDFNTMQNLFKTQTGVIIPPISPPSAPPSAFHKKQNPLDLLGNNYADPTKFSTYSGPKSNPSIQSNSPSAFGTLQTGTLNFFQPQVPLQSTTTQQNNQIPNFSKKKQQVELNLI